MDDQLYPIKTSTRHDQEILFFCVPSEKEWTSRLYTHTLECQKPPLLLPTSVMLLSSFAICKISSLTSNALSIKRIANLSSIELRTLSKRFLLPASQIAYIYRHLRHTFISAQFRKIVERMIIWL